jgi:hypothetical protein
VCVLGLGARPKTATSRAASSVVVAAVIPPRTAASTAVAPARATVVVISTEVAVVAAIAIAVATDTGATAEIALTALTRIGALAVAPPPSPVPPATSPVTPELAIQGAAVVVTSATIAVVPALGLQIDALLRDTELGTSEGQERRGACGKTRDGGPPVTLAGHHPRPVVKATIIHELLLAQRPTFRLRERAGPSILRSEHTSVTFRQHDRAPTVD